MELSDMLTNAEKVVLWAVDRAAWASEAERDNYLRYASQEPLFLAHEVVLHQEYIKRRMSLIKGIGRAALTILDDLDEAIQNINLAQHTLEKYEEKIRDHSRHMKLLAKAYTELHKPIPRLFLDRSAWNELILMEAAHDYNSPTGSINRLEERHEQGIKEDLTEYVAKGKHVIKICDSVIEELDAAPFRHFDFYEDLYLTLVELMQDTEFQLHFENHRSDKSTTLFGRPNTIYKVIHNLARNSRGAKADNFMIQMLDYDLGANPSVLIQVMDDGEGTDQMDIFKWGITYSGGNGLGLPMSLRRIEQHGGTMVKADHNPLYKGACFEIVLPNTQN